MSRLRSIQLKLSKSNLKVDGLLITNPENRRYLSGFTGSAGVLLVGVEEAMIVTDFRYWEQVVGEASGFELYRQKGKLWEEVAALIAKLGWQRIAFEAGSLVYREYQSLTEVLGDNCKLVPMDDLVEKERWIKDQDELTLIVEAAKITDQAWAATMPLIKPGIKERELALEFDYQLRRHGAERSAFPTIVASGFRGALCHAQPGEKELQLGELVILDGGAVYQGYHADMTRTVVLGKADEKQRQIYQIVLQAQIAVLEMLQGGMLGNEVDKIARQIITEAGYGDCFGHGLGHCVGLEIHENPRLSPLELNQIPSWTVVTVEPGIYLSGWGGVRIEDLVVVLPDGIINLTKSPKMELIEL